MEKKTRVNKSLMSKTPKWTNFLIEKIPKFEYDFQQSQ